MFTPLNFDLEVPRYGYVFIDLLNSIFLKHVAIGKPLVTMECVFLSGCFVIKRKIAATEVTKKTVHVSAVCLYYSLVGVLYTLWLGRVTGLLCISEYWRKNENCGIAICHHHSA